MKRRSTKSFARHTLEWSLALIFALFAFSASVHLAGSLHRVEIDDLNAGFTEGQYLWIDKWNAGPRLPMSPLQIPYTAIWSASPQLKYNRWKPLKADYHDVVVYNAIAPDSLAPDLRPMRIARIIGLPGDTLRIYHGRVYINNHLHRAPPNTILSYEATIEDSVSLRDLEQGHPQLFIHRHEQFDRNTEIGFSATRAQALTLAGDSLVSRLSRMLELTPNRSLYPNGLKEQNADNYGSVVIPQSGTPADTSVYADYHLALFDDFERKPFCQNQADTTLVFEHDYYFLLTDFRSKGSDSRFFGAVPEYLIAGFVNTTLVDFLND